MTRLRRRFTAAWEAFRAAPPQRFLIVEWVPPLGWCVLREFVDYHDAHTYRIEHHADASGPKTRVMVEAEWRRRTIANMRRRAPWIALGQMNTQLSIAQADLADERALQRVRLFDAFAESKHP
jgi:hypothetical protein